MAEFATRATGNAGLTLGIIGTAGWLLNGGAGNLFGNVFGRNCGNGQSELVSAYQAMAANLAAEKYADGVGIEIYKELISQSNRNDDRLSRFSNELAQGIINLDKKVAAMEAAQPLLFEISKLKSEKYTDAHTCNKIEGELRLPYKEICYPPYPQVAVPVGNPYGYGYGYGYGCGCNSSTVVQ